MAIKYDESRIRLFEGVSKKQGTSLIAIRFNKDVDKREIKQVYCAIQSLLCFKYGKGIE